MAGTHYPCLRAVFTGREHGRWSWSVILDTRGHGPSRSASAIVNDVIVNFYFHDGCVQNDTRVHGREHGPWTRVVCTGHKSRLKSPIKSEALHQQKLIATY